MPMDTASLLTKIEVATLEKEAGWRAPASSNSVAHDALANEKLYYTLFMDRLSCIMRYLQDICHCTGPQDLVCTALQFNAGPCEGVTDNKETDDKGTEVQVR